MAVGFTGKVSTTIVTGSGAVTLVSSGHNPSMCSNKKTNVCPDEPVYDSYDPPVIGLCADGAVLKVVLVKKRVDCGN